MKKKIIVVLSILFLSICSAQSLYQKDFYNGESSLTFSFKKGMFENSQDKSLNGVYALQLVMPVNSQWGLEGKITYINNSMEHDYDGINSGLGNIYFGANRVSVSGNSNLSFGIYLPTMSNKSIWNSELFSNIYDIGRIALDAITIRGNYLYEKTTDGGLLLGVEAGPDLMIDTDGGRSDKMELYLHLAGKIGLNVDNLKIYGEISNLLLVTSDYGSFSDRLINNFGLGIAYQFKNLEVGVNYKNTFEDTYSGFNGGLGVTMKMTGF